jgi:site-specific recombinase XerD
LINGFVLQLRSKGYSQQTIDTYGGNLRTFAEHLGDADIATVTPQDIRLFLAHVREPKPRAARDRQRRGARKIAMWTAGTTVDGCEPSAG